MAMNQENMAEMELSNFNLFKSQDPEIGNFDVVFEIDGKLLHEHKNFLTPESETLVAMLSDRWNENGDEPIKIKDYSYENFYQFLIFHYSGECQLTDSNIYSMVDMAEFYGVDQLKEYCKKYLSKLKFSNENVLQVMDLSQKYFSDQWKDAIINYIIKNIDSFCYSTAFLNADKAVVKDVVIVIKDKIRPEYLFQAVYKWCEKNSIYRRRINPTLSLNDAIKLEIAEVLPHIEFKQMSLYFLHKFVVPKAFIFSSPDELDKILCHCHAERKVKVTNIDGKILRGNIIRDSDFVEVIQKLKEKKSGKAYGKQVSWKIEPLQPSQPSSIKKRNFIEWYLTYSSKSAFGDGFGYISVKHCAIIRDNDYLLAEMSRELGFFEFYATDDCKIEFQ